MKKNLAFPCTKFLFLCLLFIFFLGHSIIAQKINFKKPTKLSKAINSIWDESNLYVSENNSNLIFTRGEYILNKASKVLYYGSKDEAGNWKYAIQFPRSDEKDKVKLRVVGSTDNGKLYFLENSNTKNTRLYLQYCDNQFCLYHLKLVELEVQKSRIRDIYIHPSDTIMLLSMQSNYEDNYGKEDLYVSIKSDCEIWGNPVNIGITVNGTASEITPFLSSDQRRLFFSSNRGDSTENYNVFYTDRLYDSWTLWTVPRELDSFINTTADETFFYSVGNLAYFISNRDSGNDIYQAEKMEYKPILKVENN